MGRAKHLLIAAPLLTAIVLLFTTLDSSNRNMQASEWDVASGQANTTYTHGRVSVTSHGHLRNSIHNEPFSYSYRYEGIDYQGSSIGFGIGIPSEDIHAGGYLRVYVNPSNPEESVLEPGWHKDHSKGLFLGVFFLGVGYVLRRRL